MKRRIISLVLALTMLCAMAITASAASRIDYDLTYGNCKYNTYTYCYSNRFSSLAEYSISDDDASNYKFSVNTLVCFTEYVDGAPCKLYCSGSYSMVSGTSDSWDEDVVEKIIPAYYVNGNLTQEFTLLPN